MCPAHPCQHPLQFPQLPWTFQEPFFEKLQYYRSKTMSKECDLHKKEKVSTICNLLYQAPPGEFSNVFEDLRTLAQDDELMRQEVAQVCAHHNKNNFTTVRIEGRNILVTRYNDLGGNRFFGPQNKFSFKFDHLSETASKFQLHGVLLDETELWRRALNSALKAYVSSYFPSGDCSVFRKTLKNRQIFVVCIVGHEYKALGFWNTIWKSEWTFALSPVITQVTGIYHLQIHYFNYANLHMTVSKTTEEVLHVIDQAQLAMDFVKLIKAEDNNFQVALIENLQALSEETWGKTVRRRLPVTNTVMNWNKLLTNQNLGTSISKCRI